MKCKNVGTQVSLIWSCCPSALSPDVGPKVVSETGEPASPNAAVADIKIIDAGAESPNFTQIGTNKTVKIGIVPKEVPIHIEINNPISNIEKAEINLLPSK